MNIPMVDLKKQILRKVEKVGKFLMNEKKTPPVYQTDREACFLLEKVCGYAFRGFARV